MRITIIGGGISGLSLAYELLQREASLELLVLEAAERAGGKIWTVRKEGFLCEAGVNGFLDNKPGTLNLASRLNIAPLRSDDNSRKRFIFTGGKLRQIPETPPAFFMSDFMSLSGRLRMIGEFFVPQQKKDDETLEDFAVRRVGREFFEKLLDPMASGVYAGDPSKLSIRSCFTKVYDLEHKYGGLIKGFMAMAKEKKKTGKKVEAGPGGVLHSFPGGMYSLIDSIRKSLGDRVLTGKKVKGIEKTGPGYSVFCEDGSRYESDIAVIASPAIDTAEMVRDMDKEISSMLKEIPYPPLSVACLGFKKDKLQGLDLNCFGYLVPGKEKRKILGTLYDSSIFPDRAPEGYALLRTMIGGARYPELAMLDDEKLYGAVLSELKQIMGLNAEPDFMQIFRWERAIPQYVIGHHERLARLDAAAEKHKGFYLTGNAYRGVAVNDCIANSIELAEKIASHGG
ncbi:MAG: protoporphyrinogen oxidase [Nitrospirae bacterium]|nr:MAG: protoporphyrinogen oxidase [Nitrospirota bacterium]